MGLTLYLVRHAETANPRDILYGRLPRFNLSARGREQAAETAEVLASLPLDAIYQSPLLRARTTAAVIAARHPGVPLHRSSLLLENLHPYQGRPQSEVAKLGDRAYDPDVLAGQGESIADLRDRMARFVRIIRRRHGGGTIAVITHADPLAALRLHLLGLELTHANLRKEAPPLASVFRADIDPEGASRLEWIWKPEPPPAPKQDQGNSESGGAPTEASSAETTH